MVAYQNSLKFEMVFVHADLTTGNPSSCFETIYYRIYMLLNNTNYQFSWVLTALTYNIIFLYDSQKH